MQKLALKQSLSQKLSPQQIQFIKLLQIPTVELDMRISEELKENPALEEGKDEATRQEEGEDSYEEKDDFDEPNIDDYVNQDEIAGYKMYGDGNNYDDEERERPIAAFSALSDRLSEQLGYLRLNETEEIIGKQLLGTIDEDGYIRRDLQAIVNDLAFTQNINTDIATIERILKRIQQFDPPGIAARDLQECLLLQLKRKLTQDAPEVAHAIEIVSHTFNEFKKKHFKKIQKKLSISEEELRDAMNLIVKLNPKPGGSTTQYAKTQYTIPDFILKTAPDGRLEVKLNTKNEPELHVSKRYSDMLDTYDKSDKKNRRMREEVTFVKQKLDAAKWFIDAIKQRQHTLKRTMQAILDYQEEFFKEGDESKLRPMILKDIAEKIDMDISTVSRVANSKFVQTDFGVFPLKFFFSESISTDSGEEVSSKEVKYVLKNIIEEESKKKPLSDDKLEKMLRARGYQIARRTVAKYREQLDIPVARLRKEV
ncbi:MAG: RNA polymerase factor sigma-54 [Bernardetiaceae bacterium]|nr:RNA polymerase factor sigma-54 [Bernardetiaceae bacterium]